MDKTEKPKDPTAPDAYQKCKKYMTEFADLFRLIPEQIASIDPEDKAPQKRKKQKVSLIQMEENIVKQREAMAKKKKTQQEEKKKAEEDKKSEDSDDEKEEEKKPKEDAGVIQKKRNKKKNRKAKQKSAKQTHKPADKSEPVDEASDADE